MTELSVPVVDADFAAAVLGVDGMTHPLEHALARRLRGLNCCRAEVVGAWIYADVELEDGAGLLRFALAFLLAHDALQFADRWAAYGPAVEYGEPTVRVRHHGATAHGCRR